MSTMDRPGQQRARSKSTFSFKSDKSNKSDKKEKHHHFHHESLHETAAEKRKSHLTTTTKANPNAAMNEAQPIAAALEKPTLQSLRSFQHTDTNGQVIAEPDLSNPTRSRWERPLDTIRSFEAAIDNEYKRRATTSGRPESLAQTEVMNGYASRRSSYYGGNSGYDQNRYSQASGYYGSRQYAAARESWADNGYGPQGGHVGGPVGGGPPRTRYNRMQSDPGWNRYNNGQGVYPPQGYPQTQSRNTINTEGSNGSHSEPYSTDPSSENSSIERATPVMKPDLGEQYGFSGFGGGPQFQGPILEEYTNRVGPSNNGYSQQGQQNGPPPVPTKMTNQMRGNRGPIRQASGQAQPGADVSPRPNVLSRANTEKRKSWFKRRFSKD